MHVAVSFSCDAVVTVCMLAHLYDDWYSSTGLYCRSQKLFLRGQRRTSVFILRPEIKTVVIPTAE